MQAIMDGFDKKVLKTSRGLTWAYYASKEGDKSLPALLFLHGFPDHALMWKEVAEDLIKRQCPYPIIVPDMLGYGESSRTLETSAYKFDGMTQDLVEIADSEGFGQVVSIGHDWGAAVACRLYNYHPNRVASLITFNVPYDPPSKKKFDLTATNVETEKLLGYPALAYWNFFTDPAAATIIEENLEKFYALAHVRSKQGMQSFLCTHGAVRNQLLDPDFVPSQIELWPYAKNPDFKQAFIARFQRDGIDAPLNYYRAMKDNLQWECDSQLPEDRRKIEVPALYVACSEDAVCRPEFIEGPKQAGLLPDLEVPAAIKLGHWAIYEDPPQIAGILDDFLTRRKSAIAQHSS